MSLVLNAIKSHGLDDPDAYALVGDKACYKYSEITSEIERRARILSGKHIIAISMDNGPEWILWDLAAIRAGIICVPIPPFFSKEQVSHALELAGVSHILLPSGMVDTGIIVGGIIPLGTNKITFTSGTTGSPKGVCLSQAGLEQVVLSLVKVLGTELADRHLSVMPYSILLENIAGVYATFLAGGTVYTPSLETIGFSQIFQPDFKKLAGYMSYNQITSAIMAPELLRGLIATNSELPDLKFLAVGGSKTLPALISYARSKKLPVYEGYGLSECGSVVSLNTPYADKTGSVGKILPHVKVLQQNNEIIIQNPAFLGYVNQPFEGPFETGDIGHVDEDGFLYIDGRKKNVLITSYGRNISPEWVESVLLAQPAIMQALVYGDGQAFLSALIVPAIAQVNIHQAVAQANQLLPEYAHIKNFHIVSPFNITEGTLTGTGRPRREKIMERYQNFTKENVNDFLQSVG